MLDEIRRLFLYISSVGMVAGDYKGAMLWALNRNIVMISMFISVENVGVAVENDGVAVENDGVAVESDHETS